MIIGLVGFIGSGKGTVGEILQQRGFEKDSFAKPLKDACASIFGWPRSYLEGDTEVSRKWREEPDTFWSEKFGFTFSPRLALQWMGTEAGRNVFHEDVWVISLLNRSAGKNIVVTDVRFENEIKHIQQSGGVVIRICRGNDPDWFESLSGISDSTDRHEYMKNRGVHPSEWDWVGTKFDYVIHNDKTLNDLGKAVDDMLKHINV